MRRVALALALCLTACEPVRALQPRVPSPVGLAQAVRARAPHASLPAAGTVAAACVIPSLVGLWRSEYGVSYAYGSAMAICGGLYLPAARSYLAVTHAACLIAYGVRLNAFLLYRELCIPRFAEFRDKIEQRAVDRGNRLARAPFILACAFLYFCMAAPLRLTAELPASSGMLSKAAWLMIGTMYLGFGTAAIGDLLKAWVKAKRGQDCLVIEGIFRWLRHPNYTGEIVLWGANAALACLCTISKGGSMIMPHKLVGAAASLIGMAGISFVLMSATANLEKKQAEKYGSTSEYKEWVAKSWSGPKL